jgi:hypothetical protein
MFHCNSVFTSVYLPPSFHLRVGGRPDRMRLEPNSKHGRVAALTKIAIGGHLGISSVTAEESSIAL